MRFLIALVIAIASSNGVVVACPLDDVLKLCVASGASLSALDKGVEHGDWTVSVLSSAPDTTRPASGSGLYTMPSGLQFFFGYRDYKDFFSSHCELNFVMAYAANVGEGMSCSSKEFTAFETALFQASLGTITKEVKNSGTAFLIERPNMWMTVILATNEGPQKPFNVWVETSVLKR
ncbi:hypothetical protein [Agrobacterium sp. ST15.13.015]|uniref:hypothetical protein n=1 Tax=Agrobacterium sp. ST15.13.015 TaxID=3017319 RepID=UPI0022C10416|nr:hypothetical protein [Agrobacterium sp. ST15.13.015]MCZ7500740.1 hypothetical protein [Rhizobium rhizogenes]